MIAEAIQKILDLSAPAVIERNGRSLSGCQLFPVKEPQIIPLQAHTLTALVDYLDLSEAKGPDTEIFAVVESPTAVRLVGKVFGPERQREEFLCSNAFELQHRFGSWMDADEFVIYLQSMFVQDSTVRALLQVAGNLEQKAALELKDDGCTQQATVRSGVVRKATVDVPNPVILRPFRTFAEIEQPETMFVFRIKMGDAMPKCALFECQGNAWKQNAIVDIKAWLQDHDITVVG